MAAIHVAAGRGNRDMPLCIIVVVLDEGESLNGVMSVAPEIIMPA